MIIVIIVVVVTAVVIISISTISFFSTIWFNCTSCDIKYEYWIFLICFSQELFWVSFNLLLKSVKTVMSSKWPHVLYLDNALFSSVPQSHTLTKRSCLLSPGDLQVHCVNWWPCSAAKLNQHALFMRCDIHLRR